MSRGGFGKFLLGLGLGVGIGMLVTPNTGEENRRIVKEKAGEQSWENNVIDEFLRTFNILPNNSNQNTSGTIEFTWWFN